MGFSISEGFTDPNVAAATGFYGDIFDLTGKKNERARAEALQSIKDYKPYGFTTGGLSGSLQDGSFTITRSPELQAQLGGLQSALSQRALEFANLRKGMDRDTSGIIGALRETGVNAIRGRSRRAVGDLRENLARRRVAGSSFAADALTRAEAQFAQEEAQFGAEVGVKEFEMKQQMLAKDIELLGIETEANVKSFQAGLTQLNLESALAAQISTSLSSIAAENARAIADIYAQFYGARENKLGTGAGILAGLFGA